MAFNCMVITREVLDTRDLTGDVLGEDKKPKESVLSTRFEPEDLNALEMALKIKDQHGGKVIALSIGKSKNVDVLRECLYRGIDDVIRIDADSSRLDSFSSAKAYAEAIRKAGDFNLILSGVNVSEGENAVIGSCIAELLGIDQISYVDNIEQITPETIKCKRAVEMGYEILEAKLPAAVNVGVALLQDDPRTPRSAKATLKLKKKKVPITEWKTSDLGGIDLSSSRTTVTAGHEAIEQRRVESKKIDPESLSELKVMLDEVMKGN